MDMESRLHWIEDSIINGEIFKYTDIKHAPRWVVNSDNKKRAR